MSERYDEPWRRLRDLEPPLGSKRRVLLQAQEEVQSAAPAPRRWLLPTTIAASGLVVVLLLLLSVDDSGAPPKVVAIPVADDAVLATAAEPAVSEAQPSHMPLDTPELLVVANDELTIRLPDASMTVTGPALVKTTVQGLRIRKGRVKVAGFALVEGPGCDVSIDGEAIVELVGEHLQTQVLSGTATATSSSCTVRQVSVLIERSREKPVPRTEPSERSSVVAAIETEPPPPTSMLRQQLDEYKVARTILGSDPAASLENMRSFLERWPATLLREEAEAGVIEALLALGRKQEARRHIQTFESRYPRSPRTSRLWERAQ